MVQLGAAPASTAGPALDPAEPPLPDEVVMVIGGSSLAGVVLPIVGPLPEQEVTVRGWQVKPPPQSASALHGSCHLNAQVDSVFVVHVGSTIGIGIGAGQSVFGGHAGDAAPPAEHSMYDRWWQTISPPQSAFVAHAFGSHLYTVVSTGGGGGVFAQSGASRGQAGADPVVTFVVVHWKPCGHSSSPQGSALALRADVNATARASVANTGASGFMNDMWDDLSSEQRLRGTDGDSRLRARVDGALRARKGQRGRGTRF